MNIKPIFYTLFIFIISLGMIGCEEEPLEPNINEPATYTFSRDGQSTVSFDGQTTRIQMATELINALKDFNNSTAAGMLEMYRNETESGGDANPFANADLNASTKSIKSKVAASADYFSANTATAALIKADFESWINSQASEVFPAENTLATAGQAGQIADGSDARFVSAQGLEYNQAVNKSLIGALMVDQMLNNYLSPAVLDVADNIANNDNGVVEEGKSYTTMEHKWDEAYGYLYGTSADLADPNATIGNDDAFLNKYIGRVEGDSDFAGIAADIYNAFKKGRAALVAGEYEIRDEQAAIIQEKVSTIIGVRAVYYLQQGKTAIEQSNFGTAFHDLSEGYGFIYSLQFTREPNSNSPYLTKSEVDSILADLFGDGANGLWDLSPSTLDQLSETIADKFDFTVAQAAN
ncbi:MAG: DUF4856 domain-containing protein [Bacteroidia bacterium]|nr:DUF4856 domain-containing protein [Bacteroidia bacterium]